MAKKYKKMTQKEKAMNKKIRDELRADGVLPPVKPKLNRKKYVEEARKEWAAQGGNYKRNYYFPAALSLILGLKDIHHHVSPEAVGAAKIIKLTIRLMEFDNKLEKEGRTTYTVGEQYEYIKDILEA